MLPQQDAQENGSSGTLKGDYHENLDGALYPLSLLGTPIDTGQSWSGAMLSVWIKIFLLFHVAITLLS